MRIVVRPYPQKQIFENEKTAFQQEHTVAVFIPEDLGIYLH